MKINLLYLFCIILFTSSCQKNTDNFNPYPLDGSIEFLFEELGLETQSKLINVNEVIDLNFEESIIQIPENSISTGSSESKIMLHLKESRNVVDVILSGVSSAIGESFIMPTHYFEINLSNDASINPDKPITIFVEIESLKGLDLFKYNDSTSKWEVSDFDFEIQEQQDEIGASIYGALISINELGKYSLGSLVNFGNLENRDVCVTLPGEYNSTNSISFLKLDENIVVPLERSSELGTFCKLNQLPVDTEMKLVVLANIRMNLYEIFVQEFPEENENIALDAVLSERELEEIRALLKDI